MGIGFKHGFFCFKSDFLDEEVNIGKLCVCGSINDVLMVGAKPKYLSLGLILEEGFELEKLERILKALKKNVKMWSYVSLWRY